MDNTRARELAQDLRAEFTMIDRNGDNVIHALIDEAATALETYAQEAAKWEWHPIETAPKDGTFILAICAPDAWCPVVVRWNKNTVNDFGTVLEEGWGDELSTSHIHGLNMPTHWMPLPKPPRAEKMGVVDMEPCEGCKQPCGNYACPKRLTAQ